MLVVRLLAITLAISGIHTIKVATAASPVVRTLGDRTYVEHVPADGSTAPMPLVVVLHGQGGSGTQAFEQGAWRAAADRHRFIVIAPEGTLERPGQPESFRNNRRSWNAGPGSASPAEHRGVDDVGYIRRVITDVSQRHRIDQARIFVTGFSNGAAMTFRVAGELSNVFAAAAPVSNALLASPAALMRPVSLALIWGDRDPLNPPAGGSVRRSGESIERPSARASAETWGALAGCKGNWETTKINGRVNRFSAQRCPPGTAVELVIVQGLGHQWPDGVTYLPMLAGPGSNALNATEFIWDFFANHPRR